jgi:hypothetical protein
MRERRREGREKEEQGDEKEKETNMKKEKNKGKQKKLLSFYVIFDAYVQKTINKLLKTLDLKHISKSFRTGRLKREMQMVQLPATRCSCIAITCESV